MPGSVSAAAASTVMPLSLSTAFRAEREYPVAVNELGDGSAPRRVLAASSRKRWTLAKRLTPALMALLRAFFEARNGGHEAFYFYDPLETSPMGGYDPTGASATGRFKVRFDGGWSHASGLARGTVEIRLIEVE